MAMAMDRLPTPRLFRLLVFDWDGTLADSTAIIAGALQQACRDLYLPAPDDAAARFVIGLGLSDALRHIAPTLPSADYPRDRKSTRLNSSHVDSSYAVFCLKNKTSQPSITSTFL